MLEPVLTTFFVSVIYLTLYALLPKENAWKQLFLLLALFGTVFVSLTGLQESITEIGASENSMYIFYVITLVGFIVTLIVYVATFVLSAIAKSIDTKKSKTGHRDSVNFGS